MKSVTHILNRAVIVGALGCFVDAYDLILFSTLRIPSLQAIGVAPDRITDVGIDLLNLQMVGMLVGGFAWGVLGDKRGRVSVLFGSIFLYSAATFANAFAGSVALYGVLRFLAGAGLAGEVGAAVTLVSEQMAKDRRGYGTMVIAVLGAIGGLTAALVAGHFDWKAGYILGGLLGFALLATRMGMRESPLFESMNAVSSERALKRGNLLQLLTPPRRFLKFLSCVLLGLPIWFVLGILIALAPELCAGLGIKETVSVSDVLFFTQLGAIGGDFGSSLVSQRLKSRKKPLFGFIFASFLVCTVYLGSFCHLTLGRVELIYALLGFTNGYHPVLFTAVAESFGTNLRSTVTISVPNLIRGSLILLVLSVKFLRPAVGIVNATAVIGMVSFGLAFVGLAALKEPYGKDLNYLER